MGTTIDYSYALMLKKFYLESSFSAIITIIFTEGSRGVMILWLWFMNHGTKHGE